MRDWYVSSLTDDRSLVGVILTADHTDGLTMDDIQTMKVIRRSFYIRRRNVLPPLRFYLQFQ